MSMGKTSGFELPMPRIKDAAILAGWITVLVLLGGLCWFLTQPLRDSLLLRGVNRVLEQSGDSRRLDSMLSGRKLKAGSWFTMTELPNRQDSGAVTLPQGTRAFVFTFIGEGTFFPCAAVVSPEGNVRDFIPLNSHGRRMIKRVSPGILKIYALRIEEAAT